MEKILAKALGEDVSKLAVAEKQLLLSRLLARLAHEIRNPLSSLDIHVQLLEEDLSLQAPQVREKLSGRLEIMHGELHRLENIVKQFLRLAGPSALELTLVNVENILKHVCGLLEPELTKREIAISTVINTDRSPILADAGQLTQALLNLVINAVQAIEENGRIELSVDQNEKFLFVKIKDTGPGIPEDKLSTIFEPYFTTKREGSGLGLWIAQQIAVAHGGDIRVANAPSGGAVFTLQLPLSKNEQPNG